MKRLLTLLLCAPLFAAAQTPLTNNFQPNVPKALDGRTGKFTSGKWEPFSSLAEAKASVNVAYRHKGLTVLVNVNGVPTEYWWRGGTADDSLIVKSAVSSGGGGAVTWDAVSDKPATFPPATHTHGMADVSGLSAALAAKAPQSHTHAQNQITGLADSLASIRAAVAAGGSGSARVVYLSAAGIPSDAVLEPDPLSPNTARYGFDATPVITALMNKPDSVTLLVVWDVKTSTSGLILPPNTHVFALPGCGAILRNASNKAIFANKYPSFSTRTLTRNYIDGGIWNGNAPNQNFVGNGTYGQVSVFRFYGCKDIRFTNFTIYQQKCYAVDVINCEKYKAENFRIDQGPLGGFFNDGIHANHCDDVVIRDGYIRCHDDAVAFNDDDRYNDPTPSEGSTYPYYLQDGGAFGPGRNRLVENIVLASERFGVRLSCAGSRADNTVIRGLSGSTASYAVVIDNFWQASTTGTVVAPGPGNFGMITLEHIQVNINGTSGGIGNDAVINVNGNVENLTIRHTKRDSFTYPVPTLYITGSGTRIRSLNLDGYESYNPVGAEVPVVHVNAATVNALRTSNIRLDGTSNVDAPLLRITNGGKVDIWQVSGVNANNVANLLDNSGGTIQAIVGSNVIHTNAGIGQASFKTSATIPRLTLSNALSSLFTQGTFTTKTGDAFASGAEGGGAITYTGDTPPGQTGDEAVGTPLTFSNRAAQISVTNGVWSSSIGGAGAADALSIPAGQTGGVTIYCSAFIDGSHGSGFIGFKPANVRPVAVNDFFTSMSLGGTGGIVVANNGGNVELSGAPFTQGRFYRMERDGQTGVITIRESSDGSTFGAPIYTYAYATTAQLFIGLYFDGNNSVQRMHNPKGTGVQ